MAEHFKQLKIKTSMLRRLRKEYDSYKKETITIQAKIHKMQEELQSTEKDEELQIHIRKNKEFLNESESVRTNVKQKLIEAFEGLVTFLSEKGEEQSVSGTQEKKAAEELVLEVQTFLENLQ